jgi:hypothetical protein
VRNSDKLAELIDVMSEGVAQDLWILFIGPWGQYQPLIPCFITKTTKMFQRDLMFGICIKSIHDN